MLLTDLLAGPAFDASKACMMGSDRIVCLQYYWIDPLAYTVRHFTIFGDRFAGSGGLVMSEFRAPVISGQILMTASLGWTRLPLQLHSIDIS